MDSKLKFKEYYRRNLPHYQQHESIFFVTTRLFFQLPEKLRKQLYEHRKAKQDFFLDFDKILANLSDSPKWLAIEKVRETVKEALHYNENKRYLLYAYCLMPNHIHILLQPISGNSLSKIMHSLKSYTAHQLKQIISYDKYFWQSENYDHLIRNNDDLINSTNYIINNPVKAGLVESWQDWKGTYYNSVMFE
ncbi:MAG: transposase [Candidatus Cloacimonetes bacterium]|nr:transposase [Candidatus Cloacimonadota bacterium]